MMKVVAMILCFMAVDATKRSGILKRDECDVSESTPQPKRVKWRQNVEVCEYPKTVDELKPLLDGTRQEPIKPPRLTQIGGYHVGDKVQNLAKMERTLKNGETYDTIVLNIGSHGAVRKLIDGGDGQDVIGVNFGEDGGNITGRTILWSMKPEDICRPPQMESLNDRIIEDDAEMYAANNPSSEDDSAGWESNSTENEIPVSLPAVCKVEENESNGMAQRLNRLQNQTSRGVAQEKLQEDREELRARFDEVKEQYRKIDESESSNGSESGWETNSEENEPKPIVERLKQAEQTAQDKLQAVRNELRTRYNSVWKLYCRVFPGRGALKGFAKKWAESDEKRNSLCLRNKDLSYVFYYGIDTMTDSDAGIFESFLKRAECDLKDLPEFRKQLRDRFDEVKELCREKSYGDDVFQTKFTEYCRDMNRYDLNAENFNTSCGTMNTRDIAICHVILNKTGADIGKLRVKSTSYTPQMRHRSSSFFEEEVN